MFQSLMREENFRVQGKSLDHQNGDAEEVVCALYLLTVKRHRQIYGYVSLEPERTQTHTQQSREDRFLGAR